MKYSKNEKAEKIVGLRDIPKNAIIFDFPCELNYHCPVCKYDLIDKDGNYDSRLDWSEYNGFIWCRECNKDYFSFQCVDDIDKQIDIALNIINSIKLGNVIPANKK